MLRFYLVDLKLVMVWSWSVHIPISLFQFFSMFWVVFLFMWAVFLVGYFKFWVLFWWLHLLPEIGICISLI